MHIVEEHQEALYHTQNLISVLYGSGWSLQKSFTAELYLHFICLKKSVSKWHSAQDISVKHWYILQ
jgi:hypothetical protein